MMPEAPSHARQGARREPLYDINPRTGVSIEVYYADRSLETFGRVGGGWFWQARRRGFAPDGLTTGPFPTSYSAYRNALEYGEPQRARRSIRICFYGNAGR
jgi:hypothetical protein